MFSLNNSTPLGIRSAVFVPWFPGYRVALRMWCLDGGLNLRSHSGDTTPWRLKWGERLGRTWWRFANILTSSGISVTPFSFCSSPTRQPRQPSFIFNFTFFFTDLLFALFFYFNVLFFFTFFSFHVLPFFIFTFYFYFYFLTHLPRPLWRRQVIYCGASLPCTIQRWPGVRIQNCLIFFGEVIQVAGELIDRGIE